MRNFARIPILVIALFATSASMQAMEEEGARRSAEDQIREHRRLMRERYEERVREEEERSRHIAEEEEQRAEATRLAAAQETLRQMIRNESFGEVPREQLVAAQESGDISNIESMIALAKEDLLQKQHDVIDHLLIAADRAVERARCGLTTPSIESIYTATRDLRYHVGMLADSRNPLTGDFKDVVDTKIRGLTEQHAELESEFQRQELERRAAPRTSARPERSRGGPSHTAEVQDLREEAK